MGEPRHHTAEAAQAMQAARRRRAEKASADLGVEPRLEWIAVDQLTVDHRYQREMGERNWSHAHRILREFNWAYYQPICVAPAPAGAGFIVIDGQHRLEAARKHPLIDTLPCYVVEATDIAAQARAFVAFNSRRIGITRLHRFWAAEAAGDLTARRIAGLCKRAGVRIVRAPQRLPACATYATLTIEKLLPLGDAAISAGLGILVEAQGEAEEAFKGCNVAAVVRLVASLGRGLNRKALVEVLSELDLEDEIHRARVTRARDGGTVELRLEERLRRRYERRVRQEGGGQ